MMNPEEMLHAIEATIQEIERNLREAKKHNNSRDIYTFNTCYNFVYTLLGHMKYGPRTTHDIQRDIFDKEVGPEDNQTVDKST